MYKDTYTKFEPKDFKYGQYKQGYITDDPPYQEWDYGDTFNLVFNGVINDIQKLPDVYDIVKIYIYDYRYKLVYESDDIILENTKKCQCKPSEISLYIDNKLSTLLVKGTYYCKIVAYSYSDLEGQYNQMTIIHPSECILHVR